MTRRCRGLALPCIAAIAGALAWPAAASAESGVVIGYHGSDIAARACALALAETAPEALRTPDGIRLSGLRARTEKILASTTEIAIRVDTSPSYTRLAETPFAFRDPNHFSAFLGSDVYRAMRDRSADPLLGIAYGGFYQLFSADVPVTEPGHLFRRSVGGENVAWRVFLEFDGSYDGSDPITTAPARPRQASVADDALRMMKGKRAPYRTDRALAQGIVHLVHAPLIGAMKNGLDKNARHLNLISSAVRPVYFTAGNAEQYARLPAAMKVGMKAWADAAANRCGAANFQLEQSAVEWLKAAGLQISSFNRAAIVETAWKVAVQNERDWTVEEFDRVVQLGGGAGSAALPSALVGVLRPDKKKDVAALDRKVVGAQEPQPAAAQAGQRRKTN